MPNRVTTSDISYPFVPEVPDRKYIAGILDARFQVQGVPSSTRATGTSYKKAYTILKSITQIVVPGFPPVPKTVYVFESIYEKDDGDEDVYLSTFTILKDTEGVVGYNNSNTEETESYIVFNDKLTYQTGDLTIATEAYEIEPARNFWFNRTIKSVSFVNEYRNYNTQDRIDLANTHLKTFDAPAAIKINSGYNVTLRYGKASNILDIDGNVSNGLGLAPDNMWDVGPVWEADATGIISINGILPNEDGDIPFEHSPSVFFVPGDGELKIEMI